MGVVSFLENLTLPWGVVITIILFDLIWGDPVYRAHPIRLLGVLLTRSEKILFNLNLNGRIGGIILFLWLSLVSFSLVFGCAYLFKSIHLSLQYIWYTYVGFSLISFRDLQIHGERIAQATNNNDLEESRWHTSMIVSRETDSMDIFACRRAGIESLSENIADGAIAPICYLMIAGLPGLILFKVISTMDSMVGYRSERYLYFGWCGARLDDLFNFIPARLTAFLMVISAFLHPKMSGKSCLKVAWNQHSLVPGPNSGWSEAGAAGALQIRLAGPIYKEGEMVSDIWLGDPDHPENPTNEHMNQALTLNALTVSLLVGAFALFLF